MNFLFEKALAATTTNYNYISMPFSNGGANLPVMGELVTRVINVILFVAGVLAIVYLIYSGILYITAAGNPDSAKKGQQGIINAVIGIVIIVLAFFIARSVANYANSAATNGSTTTTPSVTPTSGSPGSGTFTPRTGVQL